MTSIPSEVGGYVRLDSICRIVQGGRHKLSGKHFIEDGGYPAYGAGGHNGNLPSYEFEVPAIVLSAIGARCGKCFQPSGRWSSLANTSVFFPDEMIADIRFLWYQLNDEASWHRSGTAQPYIKPSDIRSRKVYFPPLAEQRRIAGILDAADALRAKRREALAELDTLIQSVFLDMFGDPVTNPMDWPTGSLFSLLETAELFVDGDWVESKDQDPDGDVRLIQLADIGDGVYIDKSSRFLTSDTALRLRCTPLKIGDILVARMPDPLGRACQFPGDARKAVTVVDVCIIRPGTQGPHPTWLMCCINTRGFRSLIARVATGTTRSRISRGNLSKLPIISPPVALQQRFAAIFASIEHQKAGQRAHLAELDTLFASLQSRAFRGEL